jgi:environmental stress-induced protein Ves
MRVQRIAEHRAMPWANGIGTSYEVASDRDASDHWSWRIAIAPVVQDGPFSPLAGVDRELVVIEGNGMVLDVDGKSLECLPGQVVQFSGDATTFARLVDGPVVDLGLMTVRGSVSGTMNVAHPGDVVQCDVLVSNGQSVFEDAIGHRYMLEANDALLDVRGHHLVLKSGTAISIRINSL